jgi:hypothetical protein
MFSPSDLPRRSFAKFHQLHSSYGFDTLFLFSTLLQFLPHSSQQRTAPSLPLSLCNTSGCRVLRLCTWATTVGR